jgi:hypothetical protein
MRRRTLMEQIELRLEDLPDTAKCPKCGTTTDLVLYGQLFCRDHGWDFTDLEGYEPFDGPWKGKQ